MQEPFNGIGTALSANLVTDGSRWKVAGHAEGIAVSVTHGGLVKIVHGQTTVVLPVSIALALGTHHAQNMPREMLELLGTREVKTFLGDPVIGSFLYPAKGETRIQAAATMA